MKRTIVILLLILCLAILAIIHKKYYVSSDSNAESFILETEVMDGKLYYSIYSEDDLRKIGRNGNPLDGNYVLKNNIELSKQWNPIGTSSDPFTGTFDGKNYIISGVSIAENSQYKGFFGVSDSALIMNIKFQNVLESGFFPVVSQAINTEINNCLVIDKK